MTAATTEVDASAALIATVLAASFTGFLLPWDHLAPGLGAAGLVLGALKPAFGHQRAQKQEG